MNDYLPRYYAEVRVAQNVIDRESEEIEALTSAIDDTLAQFFIVTATWGLARWEAEYGIATDVSKPVDQRRSVILSKRRGVGTVNAALIDSIAEAYANSELTVTEDNANYTVIITFVNAYGVPSNLADIQGAIRNVLPAHLAVNFVFRFYTYAQLIASGKAYAQISGVTYDQLYNGGLA